MQKHQSYPLAQGKCSPAAKAGEPRGKRSTINGLKGKNILQEWSPLWWQLGIIKSSPKEHSGTAELLHTAGRLVSMGGCFSVTFPKGFEGTSTMDTHPFHTVCFNTPLTITTSAIPSHQQNHLSQRGWALCFPKEIKKGQKLKPMSQSLGCFPADNIKLPGWDEAQHPDRLCASK